MNNFKDKVVAITGGATGIGYSFAKQFGSEGAKVIISGRRESRLKEAVKNLDNLGIESTFFRCDVTKRQEVEKYADFAWSTFGKVDVLVNNAGMMLPQCPVIDTPEEDVRLIYDVNFFGVWNGISVFGKRFIKQGTPAAIYNVGSESSLFNSLPMSGDYVSTKHAVLAITEALREEVPEFINVGLICPGFVKSELGNAEVMKAGMDTDKFTAIALEQIKRGEFYIVSHAYNIVRINDRYAEISGAYERYAPRYEGDNEFDTRILFG
jgi:NAD(P)-dependent dehydrogenase (short-subunit alcohol dehydrogenase family)